MRKFEAMGQEWRIEANYGSLRRVKDDTDLDLTRIIDPQDDTHQRLVSDPFLMMEVICSFLKPQLQERKITAEQLLESMKEEEGEAASMAVMEAVIDFFPPQKRTPLMRAWERMKTATTKVRSEATDKAMEVIESADFDALARSAFGISGTSSPASSESTPTPTACAAS